MPYTGWFRIILWFSTLSAAWGIILCLPVIISTTITFMLHSFFSSLVRSKYLSLIVFFLFSLFWDSKIHYSAGSPFFLGVFFLLITSKSDLGLDGLLYLKITDNFNFKKKGVAENVWNLKVTVIQIVIGALGTVGKGLQRSWGNWRSEEELKSSRPQRI